MESDEFNSGSDPGDESVDQPEQPEQPKQPVPKTITFKGVVMDFAMNTTGMPKDEATEALDSEIDGNLHLTRLDQQRERHDARVLVCEGVCNPDIHDYDALVVQMNGGRLDMAKFVHERARALRHTLHIREGNSFWHIVGGWSRRFRCTKCEHLRRF